MGPDSRWLSVVPPGAQTALVLVHGYADWTPERVGKSTGFVLGTDDVRATYGQLRDRGVHFTSEPEERPWGTYAEFEDQDGNGYVLVQGALRLRTEREASGTMGVTRVKIVSIPVAHQDRAQAFSVDVLGFEVRSDNPMGEGQRWVEVAPPGAPTSLTPVTWFPAMAPGGVKGLVLECEDIQATCGGPPARGVTFGGPIQKEFWGTFATFDPGGNGWVLAQ